MASVLKVMTYNVHGCVGTDRRLDPARIAEVIEAEAPDIVGLQELDVGRSRSGGMDQAGFIASHLRMNLLFHPAVHRAEEKYGDAILTTLPMRTVKTGELPGRGEPRGAIWVVVEHEGRPIHVFNTHLGVRRHERQAQLNTLIGEAWLLNPEHKGADTILLGDFNSVPRSMAFRRLARVLRLARPPNGSGPKATFPSRYPLLRLDHIFLSEGIECREIDVVSTRRARAASDHLPLVATLRFKA